MCRVKPQKTVYFFTVKTRENNDRNTGDGLRFAASRLPDQLRKPQRPNGGEEAVNSHVDYLLRYLRSSQKLNQPIFRDPTLKYLEYFLEIIILWTRLISLACHTVNQVLLAPAKQLGIVEELLGCASHLVTC